LKYELNRKFNNVPTVTWCGMPVTRLWRCGNRGNVASVLIEKPARGDFLPIADGGFGLQYAPLLEYREGRGMVLFCQMDVTGRTEMDPAAETLLRNLLGYVSTWKPTPRRKASYTGDPRGKAWFKSVGIPVAGGDVRIAERDGGLILIGPRTNELPVTVTVKQAEHIAAFFEPAGVKSLLAGVGPADVQNHDPRKVPLVVTGAPIIGNGVLACAEDEKAIWCQLEPWQFAGGDQPNLRRTYRRVAFLVTRLLANLGVAGDTPLLDRFARPVTVGQTEQRWRDGLYVDQPGDWDYPYRFFRW
jgi:hypothetical protein